MNKHLEIYELLKQIEFSTPIEWNTDKPIRDGSKWFVGKSVDVGHKTFYQASYGDFKINLKKDWNNASDLSDDEISTAKKMLSENQKREDEAKAKIRERVAADCSIEFARYKSTGETPYMKKKKIGELFGARINETNTLIVPLKDIEGKLWSFQTILNEKNKEGTDKSFRAGGRIKGCFHALSDFAQGKKIFICEGFSTAAAVQMALGNEGTSVAAISANNLISVALAIRKKFSDNRIIICADDDRYTVSFGKPKNTGVMEASSAAKEINAEVLIPKFKNAREGLTDFNDVLVEEGLEMLKAQLLNRAPSKNNSNIMTFVSLKDLFSKPHEEMNYVVDGLLLSGGTSLIAAKPKVGKTTLARQLALSVSTGRSFLGKKTKKGPVLYLAVEENETEVRNHFMSMGASGDEKVYIFASRAPNDVLVQLEKAMTEIKPILVVLDTLFRVVRVKDSNSYSEVSEQLDFIQDIARRYKAHVHCVHHTSKTDKEGGDAVLGSTAIFGGVDTLILMSSSKDKRYIETQQRYGESIPKTEITYDSIERTSSLGKRKLQAIEDEVAERILSFLRNCKDSVGEKTVLKSCKGKKEVVGNTLRSLVKQGVVVKVGEGKRNNPYLYRALSKQEADETVMRAAYIC